MSDNGTLLEVRDLRTYFYRRGRFGVVKQNDYVPAVDGVSFTVRAGETLGIVGESGCGKTTLGRTILRLTPATSGTVNFDDDDILELPRSAMRDKRRNMQMIFQDLDAALNPKMKVSELLAEAITLHEKLAPEAVRERSEELLSLVKLKPAKLAALPPDLSGGEKRRVSIARVLALSPKLIVADEPLSALDVSIAAQVANLMRELQERLGLSYLFISHDLQMVELIANRVMVMYLGRVVETAPAKALASGAAHPYSRLLWSAADAHGGKKAVGVADAETSWELSEHARTTEGCRFRTRCPVYREQGEPALCREQETEPELTEIAPGHSVACHFADV